MSDCIFCKIALGEIPSKIVYQDNDIMAFEDITPQAPVHILIIPKKHISNVLGFCKEDSELISNLILIANKIAKDKGIAEKGFRLVINCNKDGGQAVNHIHIHLLGGRQMGWPPG